MAAAGAGDPEWKTDLVIVAVRLPRDDREDERLRAFAATHVPTAELEKTRKFLRPEDCQRGLLSRILVRLLGSEAFGVPLSALDVRRSPAGKPYLEGRMEHFAFNVSHHGDWVVGSSLARPVALGVDVMRFEEPPGVGSVAEFFRLMQTYFTDHEWTQIRAGVRPPRVRRLAESASDVADETTSRVTDAHAPLPDIDPSLQSFAWFWVLKEAYLKARGIGLGGLELRLLDFDLCGPSVRLSVRGVAQETWRFGTWLVDEAHPMAIALGPREPDSVAPDSVVPDPVAPGPVEPNPIEPNPIEQGGSEGVGAERISDVSADRLCVVEWDAPRTRVWSVSACLEAAERRVV